jgi:hypothetical protein
MASKRDLRRRIEDAEVRASAVFGLSGPSAVEKMARMIRAHDAIRLEMTHGKYWELSAAQIEDAALLHKLTADEIRKVIDVHNSVLRDFELNY